MPTIRRSIGPSKSQELDRHGVGGRDLSTPLGESKLKEAELKPREAGFHHYRVVKKGLQVELYIDLALDPALTIPYSRYNEAGTA